MSRRSEDTDSQEQPEQFDGLPASPPIAKPKVDAFSVFSVLIPFCAILTAYVYLIWNLAHGVLLSKGGDIDLSIKPKFFWLALPLILIITGLLLFLGYVLVRALYLKLSGWNKS